MFLSLPHMLKVQALKQPDQVAQHYKDAQGTFQQVSYAMLWKEVLELALALQTLGIKKGSPVGLISENRREWLTADLGILSLGGVDVPRGNDTTVPELSYILKTTEATVCFVETVIQGKKVLDSYSELPHLKTLVVFDQTDLNTLVLPKSIQILSYQDLLSRGKGQDTSAILPLVENLNKEDLATIIFTSGTTGTPKGVMLTHGGFINQVIHVPDLLTLKSEDIWLCVLPVWHVFERVMQYVSVGNGCSLGYSKPQGKVMLADMAALRPTWIASVPRIWEALMEGILAQVRKQPPISQKIFKFFIAVGGLWSQLRDLVLGWNAEFTPRIRWLDTVLAFIPWVLLTPLKMLGDRLAFKSIHEKLGGRFIAGISGGGALPPDVDRFFAAVGILLLEGYGITETCPVLGVRHQGHPWPGTVGPVFPGMEVEIRDTEGKVLPPGQKGIIFARGPQVMKGYFKDPALTAQVMDSQGWFNTGDLGMLGHNGELKILGRAKDTIVLRGGENVEPYPIETKLKESHYIQEAVLVGQDQKFLGALILPSSEALDFVNSRDPENFDQSLRTLIGEEIRNKIGRETGFKDFERVLRFNLLTKAFEVDRELSSKQEIKRHKIQEIYAQEIAELFN